MNGIIETIVIGAGPAGLTAGYTLAKKGHGVLVLEQDLVYVGGISRTARYKGFLFDIGGHRFFSKSKEIVDLWNEILPDDFIDRPRLSRIFYRRKFYAYPLKAFEALKNLGPLESARCMASFAWARAFPTLDPKTFHQWVRNQFGERLFGIFFKTYTEKVWGMGCDEISADWAAQRIKSLSLGAAIMDGLRRSFGLRKSASKEGVKTLIESFSYPRRGPGMMWEAAAEKIQQWGGRLLMGRKVDALHYEALTGTWTVWVTNGAGGKESYRARHVLSSAPIREIMNALAPRPESLQQARDLKYRDFLTVVLIGRPERELPDNWIYIHDPAIRAGRVQNFKSWSPSMIPDGVSTCLGLEYFCFEGDGLWNARDEELIDLAKAEIAKIGLMTPTDVTDACVVRQAKAYPVYDDGYADNVKSIRLEIAARFPTLHLIGRNGMHKYNNQDHAMMTGMVTALNIMAGKTLYDVWRVNEDAEYGEEGVAGGRECGLRETWSNENAEIGEVGQLVRGRAPLGGSRAALASERLVPRRVAS